MTPVHRVLFTRPLTAPREAPVPPGWVEVLDENRLSWELGQGHPRTSERRSRLAVADVLRGARARYDAVVTGKYGEYAALLRPLLPGARVPHVLLDVEWLTGGSRARDAISRELRRRVIAGADRVQVFTHAAARRYAEYFDVPAHKFAWLPYCIDVPAVAPAAASAPYALSAGAHGRDYPTLLRAVAGLPIAVRIVAPAGALAGLDVPPNVALLPPMSRDAYRQQLAGASCLVLSLQPGLLRSTGVVTYVEAMRYGKCVVLNETEGAPSYVEDGVTGLLAEPGDPDALRARLARVIADPAAAARIGAAAADDAARRFSVAAWFARVQSLVDEVVAESRARRRTPPRGAATSPRRRTPASAQPAMFGASHRAATSTSSPFRRA